MSNIIFTERIKYIIHVFILITATKRLDYHNKKIISRLLLAYPTTHAKGALICS